MACGAATAAPDDWLYASPAGQPGGRRAAWSYSRCACCALLLLLLLLLLLMAEDDAGETARVGCGRACFAAG